MDELIQESRFANPSFAYGCHDLTMTSSSLFQSLIEDVNFWTPSNKLSQSTRHSRL
jgi:hypothetical protein